jgi:hypothetical protein
VLYLTQPSSVAHGRELRAAVATRSACRMRVFCLQRAARTKHEPGRTGLNLPVHLLQSRFMAHVQCSVCRSPQRQKIDEQLLAGRTEREVAKEVGLSRSAIHRHSASHLAERLARARIRQERRETRRPDPPIDAVVEKRAREDRDLAVELRALADRARVLVTKAEQREDAKTALAGVREIGRLIEIEAKVAGIIGAGVQVNIAALDVNKLREDEVRALQDRLWERCPQWTLKMVRSVTDKLDEKEHQEREERTRRAAAAASQGCSVMPELLRPAPEPEVVRPASGQVLTYTPDPDGILVARDERDNQQYTRDEVRRHLPDVSKPSVSLEPHPGGAKPASALAIDGYAWLDEAARAGKLDVPASHLQGAHVLTGMALTSYLRTARDELKRGVCHPSGRPWLPGEFRARPPEAMCVERDTRMEEFRKDQVLFRRS